jgi:hypothetical protein
MEINQKLTYTIPLRKTPVYGPIVRLRHANSVQPAAQPSNESTI